MCAWLLPLATACNAEQSGGDNPFNSGSGPSTASPPTTAGDTGDDEDTGSGGSSGDDADGGSSGGGVGSTGDESAGSTTDMSDGGSTGGGNPNGMQPGSGMYSDCLDNSACGAQMCLTITDEDMNPIDGFCTTTCTNAAMDCDASPVATAPAACMDSMVNGMPGAVCALSCSGGAGCPPPMTCYDFGAAGEFCG